MSQPPPDTPTMLVRVSVPAGGEFRAVAADLAAKVAEYLGQQASEASSAREIVHSLVAEVVPRDHPAADITIEFHRTNGDLRIEARCAGRSSEARHPLPT
jgi:hypothetical protein